MALTLDKSSIGFDENRAQVAISLTKGHVVDGTNAILVRNETLMRDCVNDQWVGESAEVFKSNFAADVNTIKRNISESFEIYEKEIAAIAEAMGKIDSTAVKSRS